MKNRTAEAAASLIQSLSEDLPATLRAEDREQVCALLAQYYHRVSPEDLFSSDPIDLRGAVLAHWHLARKRLPGETHVHAYNPDFEQHGWQCKHSVIEIVTDDMPFLVDSVSMVLHRLAITIHLTVHPVVRVERDEDGDLRQVMTGDGDGLAESFMHFQIDRQPGSRELNAIVHEIETVIGEVRAAYRDWSDMRQQALEMVEELTAVSGSPDGQDTGEAAEFVRWIEANHFTFLGYCQLGHEDGHFHPAPESRLGILSEDGGVDVEDLVPWNNEPHNVPRHLLTITKASIRSRIHRPAYLDLIAVNRYDKAGKMIGQHFIVGLFTSAAYNRNTREIPLLRDKVERVLKRSKLTRDGHSYKALQNVIEQFPRDSLIQADEEELFDLTTGILELQERLRIRVFVRRDPFGRYFWFLVYVPRERYSRELRIKIQDILMGAYGGNSVEFDTHFSESVLARIQFTVFTDQSVEEPPDPAEIQRRVVEAARSWDDNLKEALIELEGENQGLKLFSLFGETFPLAFQEDFSPRTAAFDLRHVQRLHNDGDVTVKLYRPLVETTGGLRMKVYARGRAIAPSDALPILENMGLKVLEEHPYRLETDGFVDIWIHDFQMHSRGDVEVDVEAISENFKDAFLAIWYKQAENDGFNRLVVDGFLNWREIAVLRAVCKYLRQIRIRYSESYMIETLVSNPRMAKRLVRLFHERMSPESSGELDAVRTEIHQGLERVVNLDEDRILSAFNNIIEATLRTNYYQSDENGKPKAYVSLKLNPREINRMPEPRPQFEIFVYSPRVEAVHLRGGPVARGGLRWSDRREDFRTEVLGLVKAQMVKNAVIVPTGSKGGFVAKGLQPGMDREAVMAEGIECYKTFIRGMLDITDNLAGGDVVPPKDVVRHDGDDPYLVVAADKGTATFSDIANGVAIDYGFWLGDAFASGGSEGYDHKKMGITARGAWESVKRCFRELGVDTQNEPFTVIGIGDMSGDVFGNGMLLSRHIRLIGAFNHLHIFLDPDPDPESSFKERERIFKLPRSSWSDYDQSLISKGGGVFDRSVKSIELTPEIQAALKIQAAHLTPAELINAMLKAPVDLLWNGGIGTYVKSESETHEQASDRANDGLRVNGRELRCKVLGEGGNLGVTQLGRIEFCRHGGKCYTDFIDNSAGVDTSDHEVNIKILLSDVVEHGDITGKQRNNLLADMTEEVAELVLKDNYDQTQAISVSRKFALGSVTEHSRLMRVLEQSGRLNRQLEFLPEQSELMERAVNGSGLTQPEISVLLAYSKMELYNLVMDSDAPDDDYFNSLLHDYFPERLRKAYTKEIDRHRLKREIIGTCLTNQLVNRVGAIFPFRMFDITGAGPADVARAFTACVDIFDLKDLWQKIELLDNKVDAAIQYDMLRDTAGLIERNTQWILRNCPAPIDCVATIGRFQPGVRELTSSLPRPLAAPNRLVHRNRLKSFVRAGISSTLASRVAAFYALSAALEIVAVAQQTGQDVIAAAGAHFLLGEVLELQWLRDSIGGLAATSHWHSLAQSSLRADLHDKQQQITAIVLGDQPIKSAKTVVGEWESGNRKEVERFRGLVSELRGTGQPDFAMLSVAVSELNRFTS